MDEKPRIVAYKLIIDANIVKHRGRTERQNIVVHPDRSKQYERVPWLGNVLQRSQAIGHKTAFLSVRDWASFVP
jgi:hypothetical protein